MSSLAPTIHAVVRDDYLELVRAFPLRALRSDNEHAAAVQILTRLLGRPHGRLSAGERDYAGVLGGLIDDYARRKRPFSRRKYTPVEILRFLMRENRMNTEALGKVLGNKTAASLILNGKRELSKTHIRRLAARFHVDPGLFL